MNLLLVVFSTSFYTLVFLTADNSRKFSCFYIAITFHRPFLKSFSTTFALSSCFRYLCILSVTFVSRYSLIRLLQTFLGVAWTSKCVLSVGLISIINNRYFTLPHLTLVKYLFSTSRFRNYCLHIFHFCRFFISLLAQK